MIQREELEQRRVMEWAKAQAIAQKAKVRKKNWKRITKRCKK